MAKPAPGSPSSLGLPGLIPAPLKGPGLWDARPAANLTGSTTCFEDNPFAGNGARIPNAAMTVLGGEIVYDAEDEDEENWRLATFEQIL